jgi:bifunctional DNA-binding transcriptional regulator/antitoxin component of YhaV-PrlF toxin-antitoxin module
MPHEVTLRSVDGTLRLDLPEDVAERRRYRDGDRVHLIETSQGLLVVPYDDDFADAMAVYEEGAETYADALQTLAADDRPE